MSQVIITTDVEVLISEWDQARRNADHWSSREKELRVKLYETLFPGQVSTKGQHKIRLPYEMAMVGEVKINYTVDKPAMLAMMDNPENAVLVNDVISHSPKVKNASFEKLKGNSLEIMSSIITGKPGLPSLELKPAAEIKKW